MTLMCGWISCCDPATVSLSLIYLHVPVLPLKFTVSEEVEAGGQRLCEDILYWFLTQLLQLCLVMSASCAFAPIFTLSQSLITILSVVSPLVLRCLMDSGAGMRPGPPPDPCHSTSAPSRHLPRALTWKAAATIQSEGEAECLASESKKQNKKQPRSYTLEWAKDIKQRLICLPNPMTPW